LGKGRGLIMRRAHRQLGQPTVRAS
jgi:hypothetical protein